MPGSTFDLAAEYLRSFGGETGRRGTSEGHWGLGKKTSERPLGRNTRKVLFSPTPAGSGTCQQLLDTHRQKLL